MLNLAQVLESNARCYPEKVAIIDKEGTCTYGELERQACRIAHGLVKQGIQRGDRVALFCPTSTHFVACYFGILKTGAVVVPLNVLLRRPNIAELLRFARISVGICHEGFETFRLSREFIPAAEETPGWKRSWVIPASGDVSFSNTVRPFEELTSNSFDTFDTRQVAPDEPALINFTSGTTDTPKGAVISHASDLLNLHAWTTATGTRHSDVVAGAIGLFTGYGRTALLNPAMRVGATLVFAPRFELRDMLGRIAAHKATIFVGVPAMYHAFASLGTAGLAPLFPSMRLGIYGGAAMLQRLRKFFREEMRIDLFQGYGLTECCAFGHTPPNDSALDKEDVLTPLWGTGFQIVNPDFSPVAPGETGEIVSRGPYIMKGYLGPDGNVQPLSCDEWFHTGDVGRLLETNRFAVVDRMIETINRGGYKIYPAEVERVLAEHPGVDRAAVKGLEDERLGHEVAAYVALKPGSPETAQTLQEWARERLPRFAYPRYITLLKELPVGPTGKVQKNLLAEPCGANIETSQE